MSVPRSAGFGSTHAQGEPALIYIRDVLASGGGRLMLHHPAPWVRKILAMSFRGLLPEFAAQQISPMMERVFATGHAQAGREWRFQVGDSDDPRREYFLDFVVEPYLDGEDAVAGITAFAIDVTEQVRLRQADQDRAIEAERRYAHALDVIRTLQQQLPPPGLPVLPSEQIAASYLLADADTAAGGDWFDAVPLPEGRVALVVGDVVDHGVAASAAMGQLRTVLQDRLDDTSDLLGAIRAADRLARRVPAARAATVCVAALDPVDGTLTWCSAGHPPPTGGERRVRALPSAVRFGPAGHRRRLPPGRRPARGRRYGAALQRRHHRTPRP